MNYVRQLNSIESKPYLFSYRRCPYAMRARMALVESNILFDVYEISLRDKPKEMISVSPKGTVPVLLLNKLVLDESLEIMKWAYKNSQSKHLNLLDTNDKELADELITMNDYKFKPFLDKYKYFERHQDKSKIEHRENCYFFLKILEKRLKKTNFLIGNKRTYLDISIFPFIRQFMNVDKDWFDKSDFKMVKEWLTLIIESELFKQVMIKP